MGFRDISSAADFKSVMVNLIDKRVDRIRPTPRLARVVFIDRIERKCQVVMNGDPEDATIPVPMGSIQPVEAGQYVRIDGPAGARYIGDVIGKVFLDTGVTTAGRYDFVTAEGDTIDLVKRPWLKTQNGVSKTLASNALEYIDTWGTPEVVPDPAFISNPAAERIAISKLGWYRCSAIVSYDFPTSSTNRTVDIEWVDISGGRRFYGAQTGSTVGSSNSRAYENIGPITFPVPAAAWFSLRCRHNASAATPVNMHTFELEWLRDL